MTIRQCKRQDLPLVAALHKRALRDEVSLLAQSSPSTTVRFYLECLGNIVFLVNEREGGIDGFVLGGKTDEVQAARRRFYWKNLHLCLGMASRGGLSAALISRWRNLFAGTGLESRETALEASQTLLLLAVSDEARGTGLALKLVEAFEGTLAKPCRYNVSVAKENSAAIRFYLKMNCKVTRETCDSLMLVKDVS